MVFQEFSKNSFNILMESSFPVDPVIIYLFNLKEVLLPGKL